MITIIDKQCDCIVEVVRMIKAQVEDAECPECRAGNFMFAPVPCDALEAMSYVLGKLIRVFDSSYGTEVDDMPVLALASHIESHVDGLLNVARKGPEAMGGSEKEYHKLLDERIRAFYMQVKAIEAVNMVRLGQ
jgi:hypothetical protein